MSKLIYKNRVNDNATATHAVNTGTVTALTPDSNMFNRSVVNAYHFETSEIGAFDNTVDHTITITVEGFVGNVNCFALLGLERATKISGYIESIKLQNLVGVDLYTLQQNELTERYREINGQLYYDGVWVFDSLRNVRKIEIKLAQYTGKSGAIGSLYLGTALDVNIKPTSLNYKFNTQGTKTRTIGGQIIASRNSSYMLASFTTTATAQTSVINTYFDINYVSSVSEPIIFIPEIGGDIILYGTQQTTNTTNMILGRDNDEWLYETSFKIEEEL